jgi:hypothetical protein
MNRRLVLAAAIVFIAGFGFLTYRELAEQGITALGLVSVFIVVLLAVGIIGALRNPPR